MAAYIPHYKQPLLDSAYLLDHMLNGPALCGSFLSPCMFGLFNVDLFASV